VSTHPVTQKANAVEAARAKAKGKGKAPAATAKPSTKKVTPSRWRDTNGVDLVKGVTVEHDGKRIGTVSYRHTHSVNSNPVGMIGVSLAKPAKVGGRTVKNRSFRADELTAVPE